MRKLTSATRTPDLTVALDIVEDLEIGRTIQIDALVRPATVEDDELERPLASGRLRGQLSAQGVGDHLTERRPALCCEALGGTQEPFVERNRRPHASQHTTCASLHQPMQRHASTKK